MKTARVWLIPFAVCIALAPGAHARFVEHVNPIIGTEGGGNVFPGPSLPFGYAQPGPDTGTGSNAGGFKNNKTINAFSQQHLSGMGGPVLGQFSVFPFTGDVADPANISATGKSQQSATPGYYTVTLQPWDVKVELTASHKVGYHRHTFPASDRARILFDVGHCLFGDKPGWHSAAPVAGEVTLDPVKREVSGRMTYRGGRSTREPWTAYFVARFDATPAAVYTWADSPELRPGSTAATGAEIGALIEFPTTAGQVVNTRVAVSWRSVEQARATLDAEGDATFDTVRARARDVWEETLGRVEVEGGTPEQLRLFYTALYRAHLTPNDWTGEAPAAYGDAPYYENILCLWDTYRTPYPLLTLLAPERVTGIVNTLLAHHRVKGWTGDAHSVHQYEHVQNGSAADIVIADAYVKKLPGIDWPAAYAAIRKNAFEDPDPAVETRPLVGRFRLNDYLTHGYLPTDATRSYHAVQSVSRTLEYVHNDSAVLTLARDLGSPADVAALEKRSLWYKNLFDPATGFMRGKNAAGEWLQPFDPLKTETGRQYYEGHAWTWLWHVPHDPQGLINLFGGDAPFVEKLATACERHYQAYNEPGMLQTYLFIHAGRPDLTQHYARHAQRHFTTAANGLPGNDDSGTTSAWLVWTMLGLYPNAGQDFYYIGSPVFPKATIHLPSGKKIVLRAPATSSYARYIQSARLDGRPLDRAWLRHAELIDGATLDFDLAGTPAKWGAGVRPPSVSAPAAAR